MKERDYILATNLAKVRLAIEAAGGILLLQHEPMHKLHRDVMKQLVQLREALERDLQRRNRPTKSKPNVGLLNRITTQSAKLTYGEIDQWTNPE